ncbi:hypothetical protein ES703_84226 [subsurface metagenome]
MPLETMPAHRIRLKTFSSVDEFNDWISKQKGIVLAHLASVYQGRGKKGEGEPRWAILATYLELEKVKK